MLNTSENLNKKYLRLHFTELLQGTDSNRKQSKKISQRLFDFLSERFPKGADIAAFAPDDKEVHWYLDFSDASPWTFHFPKINEDRLDFYPSKMTYLHEDKMNYSLSDKLITGERQDRFDLILVPGLAFTKDCFRLGRGGGYYDRLLQNRELMTLGLSFRENLTNKLPTETHDQQLNMVLTDHDLYINKENS